MTASAQSLRSANRMSLSGISAPVAVLLGVTALLCALPGLILGRIVEGYSTIWVGVLGSIVGTLIGALIAIPAAAPSAPRSTVARPRHRFGLGAVVVPVVVMMTVAAVLTVAVAALRPGVTQTSLLTKCVDALVRGWAELATSPVPTFAVPRTLVPVALVSYFAAAVSAFCVRKTTGPLVVLLAPACAFLLSAVAAGSRPFVAVSSGLLFVVLSGVVLASRQRPQSSSAGNQSSVRRRQNWLVNHVSLAGLGIFALVGALIIGPVVSFGRDQQPFDPRDRLTPPVLPSSAISPLELVASRRLAGTQPLFTVRTSQPLYAQDLHLVALNHFNGATWSTTAPYKRGGAVLDSVVRPTIGSSPIEVEVLISELEGPWLPSIGDPSSVAGVPVIVDSLSGSLVSAEPVKSGISYQLKSQRPEPKVEQLLVLPVGSSEEARDALVVPDGMPPLLSAMARTAIGDAQLPFQRAVELRNYLRSSFTLNNSAPGGFSYGHLERAFVNQRVATDEQFATMFATLGRVVGLPTRVVVGFTPAASGRGDIVVYGADARVWAEVLFEGAGWMPFTATPLQDGQASSSIGFGGQDQVELREADPATPTPEPAPVLQATDEVAPDAKATGLQMGSFIVPVLAVLLLLVFSLIAVALLKLRKTSQRRAGAPRDSVIGAWRDVLDRLTEAGVERTSLMTVEEVVQTTEASSTSLAGLYRPLNRALYSTDDITDSDREQAWRARDRFVSSLNRRTPWPKRVIHSVNPRPLFGSNRPSSTTNFRTRSDRKLTNQSIGARS
jgi:transglutaminase-like putative cysteine protease